MHWKSNEKGYALLLVLFAVVFITVLSAVFMRATLSNAKQGQTIDKNNLVVVSAEAGVDYYTWKLKQLYDEDLLESKFNAMVNDYISSDQPVDYKEIQRKIVEEFEGQLNQKAKDLTKEQPEELFSHYKHTLRQATITKEKKDDNVYLVAHGTVRGELSQFEKTKTKDLSFKLRFTFPQVFIADSSKPESPDAGHGESGSLITMPALKTPIPPNNPNLPVAINKPTAECKPSGNMIENQQCKKATISEANYKINKSGIYMDGTLNSWGEVQIENSSMNIRGDFTPASFLIGDTQLVVGGAITAYQSILLNKSHIETDTFNNSGGMAKISNSHLKVNDKLTFQRAYIENSFIDTNSYETHNDAEFHGTHLTVKTTYQSGGAHFSNSYLEIGKTMNFGGGLFYAAGSNVKIHGDALAANGSTILNSIAHIGGSLTHTSKSFTAKNSDIFIGGNVEATNGTDFEHVNMVVKGRYDSSKLFTLDNTNLSITNSINLGNGGEMENSQLTASKVISSNALNMDNAKLATNYLQSDKMDLKNAKVCAAELNVRALDRDNNSTVYYQQQNTHLNGKDKGKITHTGKNIIKLTSEEYIKKCNIQTDNSPENPESIGTVNWKAPVVEDVTY